jgi:Cdc6-like AAA superfamily ATPase
MFTQEEFESAYEIMSGFNNIRKQIINDPKLLSTLYELYKNSGFNVKGYEDVDSFFIMDVRYSILNCYTSLGYPYEYDRNVFEHFDLLTEVLYRNGKSLNYTEYEDIWTSPNHVADREYYEKMFNLCHKYAVKYFTLERLYAYLLKTDEYIAETFLILIKRLAHLLEKSQHVTSDGDKWYLKLMYNNLGLNPNDKLEYKIKSDEKLTLSIESDYFDLIENITDDLNSFVENELYDSEDLYHYLTSHQVFKAKISDREIANTAIEALVKIDMCRTFKNFNHSINIDTKEGKILFLYILKQTKSDTEFQFFNRYCYPLSLDKHIIHLRVNVDTSIRTCNELVLVSEDLKSNNFCLRTILDQIDKELSKKYMVLLYRFASVVAKADGKITDEEEDWLSQMLAMTEADKDRDEEQPDIRISQGGSNPIEELESLIGLESVKKDVVSLANFIKMKKMREEKGLKAPNISYHCVFSGNPGTGKTTVARILANIFKELGILKSGHLVETDRSGLVAEYVGQTAVKTNKIIDSALDGVLFIDEAYTLVGGQNDYGKEAIATLLKRMEDDRERLIVILAGYSEDMEEFINSNPGLRSRFNRYIKFPDYTSAELFDIFQLNASKNEYIINEEANQYLKKRLDIVVQNKQKDFGNARYIRNYFELAIEHQANRLAADLNLTPEKLCELTLEDVDINS